MLKRRRHDLKFVCDDNNCSALDCRLMPSRRYGTLSARFVVGESWASEVEKISWPSHIFVRPWSFDSDRLSRLRHENAESNSSAHMKKKIRKDNSTEITLRSTPITRKSDFVLYLNARSIFPKRSELTHICQQIQPLILAVSRNLVRFKYLRRIIPSSRIHNCLPHRPCWTTRWRSAYRMSRPTVL